MKVLLGHFALVIVASVSVTAAVPAAFHERRIPITVIEGPPPTNTQATGVPQSSPNPSPTISPGVPTSLPSEVVPPADSSQAVSPSLISSDVSSGSPPSSVTSDPSPTSSDISSAVSDSPSVTESRTSSETSVASADTTTITSGSSGSVSTPLDTGAPSTIVNSGSSAVTQVSSNTDATSTAAPTSSITSLSTSPALPSDPTSPAPAPISTPTVGPAEKQIYLDQHNSVRQDFNAQPLTWSDDLQAKAQSYAEGCELRHSNGVLGPFGENLAAATGSFDIPDAVSLFVRDKSLFSRDPSQFVFSHFTQVVWKSTTQVGCGIALCDNIFPGRKGKATYHVCLYDPVGNIIGQERENLPI